MRILERVAISFSRGSSRPRGRIYISCVGRWIFFFYFWATFRCWTIYNYACLPTRPTRLYPVDPHHRPAQAVTLPSGVPFALQSRAVWTSLLLPTCWHLRLCFTNQLLHPSLTQVFRGQGSFFTRLCFAGCPSWSMHMSGARVDGQRNPEDENIGWRVWIK